MRKESCPKKGYMVVCFYIRFRKGPCIQIVRNQEIRKESEAICNETDASFLVLASTPVSRDKASAGLRGAVSLRRTVLARRIAETRVVAVVVALALAAIGRGASGADLKQITVVLEAVELEAGLLGLLLGLKVEEAVVVVAGLELGALVRGDALADRSSALLLAMPSLFSFHNCRFLGSLRVEASKDLRNLSLVGVEVVLGGQSTDVQALAVALRSFLAVRFTVTLIVTSSTARAPIVVALPALRLRRRLRRPLVASPADRASLLRLAGTNLKGATADASIKRVERAVGRRLVGKVDEAVAGVAVRDGVDGHVHLFKVAKAGVGQQVFHIVRVDRVEEVSCVKELGSVKVICCLAC